MKLFYLVKKAKLYMIIFMVNIRNQSFLEQTVTKNNRICLL